MVSEYDILQIMAFQNAIFYIITLHFESVFLGSQNYSEKFFSIEMSFFSLLRKKASFGYCTFAAAARKPAKT